MEVVQTSKRKSAKAQTSADADALRERRISRLARKLAKVAADERRDIWEKMRREIAARSASQVARMEAARGLAK